MVETSQKVFYYSLFVRSNPSDPERLKDELETRHLKLVRMVRIGEYVIGGNVSAEEIKSIEG